MSQYRGKRVTVTIPEGIWNLIETKLKGVMGDKDSEIIRNIVIAWLSEKSYLKNQSDTQHEES